MNTVLRDDVWKRRGISVLWDGETLSQFDAVPKIRHLS